MPVATVIFTGIVLLRQPAADKLTASMPDASQARPSINLLSTTKPFGIPPHLAYVMVKTSQVFGTARPPDLQFTRRNGDAMSVYFIQGEESIEVTSDSTDSVILSTAAGGGPRKPFANVIETHQLAPLAGLKGSPRLAGSVVLRHGAVFAGNLDGKNWTVENSQLSGTRQMAETVIVDFMVKTNQVTLTSSMGGKNVALTDGVNKAIEIEFGNGPLLAVLGACPPSSTALICNEGDSELGDFH